MGMDELTLQKRLSSKRNHNEPITVADWTGVDSTTLIHCISAVTCRGGAVRLGYTRDGGAYAIGVYYGDENFTDYVRPHENIDQYLEDLAATFSEVEPAPEPRARKGKK